MARVHESILPVLVETCAKKDCDETANVVYVLYSYMNNNMRGDEKKSNDGRMTERAKEKDRKRIEYK